MSDLQNSESGFSLRTFGAFNVVGLKTFALKEVKRFLAVYTQTLVAPVITMVLFYAVFSLALGGAEREVVGIPFMDFVAPGLIVMAMAQNAFANTSSSMVIAKVQGNIVDILMPPLSALEIFAGYILGAVARGLLIGLIGYVALFTLTGLGVHSILSLVVFGFLGSMMLGTMGLIGGIWADKFDHIAAVTNFIITPLTFLSGTFYPLKALPGFWYDLAHYNPFFYMINGFRFGATGITEASIWGSIAILVGFNAFLSLIALRMLAKGYKLKS